MKMKNQTIINKGNYSFETPEREELFHKHKGEGWSKEYKEYRLNWEEYPQRHFVSKLTGSLSGLFLTIN